MPGASSVQSVAVPRPLARRCLLALHGPLCARQPSLPGDPGQPWSLVFCKGLEMVGPELEGRVLVTHRRWLPPGVGGGWARPPRGLRPAHWCHPGSDARGQGPLPPRLSILQLGSWARTRPGLPLPAREGRGHRLGGRCRDTGGKGPRAGSRGLGVRRQSPWVLPHGCCPSGAPCQGRRPRARPSPPRGALMPVAGGAASAGPSAAPAPTGRRRPRGSLFWA